MKKISIDIRPLKGWHWTLYVQFWIGLIDNLVGIASFGLIVTSFELQWACWRTMRDCQKKLEKTRMEQENVF